MLTQTVILFISAGVLGYLVFRFGNIHDPLPYVVSVLAVILFLTGVDSCRAYFRNDAGAIAAQHVGHEAMHAQIEKDLKAAEPGDILERPGEHMMFVTGGRTSGSIDARSIYGGNDRWIFYISNLVLAHAKIIKLGTPEHAAALEAEAAITFSYYRRKPR